MIVCADSACRLSLTTHQVCLTLSGMQYQGPCLANVALLCAFAEPLQSASKLKSFETAETKAGYKLSLEVVIEQLNWS